MWLFTEAWCGLGFRDCAVNTNKNGRFCGKISCTEAIFGFRPSGCCFIFLSLCPDVLAHMTKTNLKVITRKPYKQHAYLPHATTLKWHPPSIYTNLRLVKMNVWINCCTKHHEWRWAKSLTSLFLFVAARGHVNTTESHPPPFHPIPPTPLLALHEETDNWHIGLLNRRKEGI